MAKVATKRIMKAAEVIARDAYVEQDAKDCGMDEMARSYFMRYMTGINVLDIMTGAEWSCYINKCGDCVFFDCSNKYEDFVIEL